MINLLPYDTKKEVRAARMNISLIHYIVLIGVCIVFLAVISIAVYIELVSSRTSAQNATTANEVKANGYGSVQTEIATFRNNLSTTKTILSQSVDYSSIMIQIAQLLPPGVVLDNLTLSTATIGTPITLSAHAANNNDALALKDSFSHSALFTGVSILTLANTAGTDVGTTYPIAVTLNVTINKAATE
jgi:Tfp pilus assembly protein PilN